MNLDTLQKITTLASFVFDDADYKSFIKFVAQKEYQKARVGLDRQMSKFELSIENEINSTLSITLYEKANQLEDIVMDLIIEEMEDAEGEIRNIT